MSRAARALLLLLLAPALLAAATPAEAQAASTPSIPTERKLTAGPLDVTVRIIGDTTAAAFRIHAGDALGALYNTNLTAGSLGFVQVIAQAREDDAFDLDVALRWDERWFRIQSPNATSGSPNGTVPGLTQPCVRQGTGIRCTVNGTAARIDTAITFFPIMAAPPGTHVVTVEAEAYRTSSGARVFQGRGNASYDFRIIDPIPAHAVRAEAADTVVAAWPLGGTLGLGGATACGVGAALSGDLNVSRGTPSSLCVVAIPRSEQPVRVRANATGAAWLGVVSGWQSQELTRDVGALSKPVGAVSFVATTDAPLGPAQATVHYVVERQENGTWVPAGEGDLAVSFVVAQSPFALRGPASPNWLLQAPVLLAAVAGLGYMAQRHRRVRVQPRSQALRELSKRGKRAEPATAERVQEQHREVAEAAVGKKRQILEAKKEDILKSIRLADERKQRGEITEHVLQGIRERKMRQLEQVDQELRELQDE